MNLTANYHASLRPLALTALLPCFILTSGCTTPDSSYPSLAIRDVERVQGQMDIPAPPPLPLPDPSPSSLAGIAQLEAIASAANQAFMAATPAARSKVQAASGAAIGSDRWAEGQVALADLEAIRSRAMIALADLDQIYVNSATQGESLIRIGAAHQNVSAMVAQQDGQIAALGRNLR